MATTETTYELWYQVRLWAEANGYFFQNMGREGNDGVIGAVPTSNKNKPVTTVSWRDVIVWTNALSEMTGLNPVYRMIDDWIVKDSRDSNADQVDSVEQFYYNNGYRLPTSNEWEMAARWKNDTTSTNGSISVGGRYWTPSNYTSGATVDYNNEAATRAVAWYYGATGGNFTRPVGLLLPNHLGIYDMSGNVWEWTYTTYSSYRIMRGGFFSSSVYDVRVADVSFSSPGNAYDYYGFRMILGQ
jgi:formylglycine-generating enzyme